jgi:hypothetical protein
MLVHVINSHVRMISSGTCTFTVTHMAVVEGSSGESLVAMGADEHPRSKVWRLSLSVHGAVLAGRRNMAQHTGYAGTRDTGTRGTGNTGRDCSRGTMMADT